jgi:hypothetical protein
MKRNGAAIALVLAILAALTAVGGRQYKEQSGVRLVPDESPLTLERIDGGDYIVYPALIKTIDSEWTAALVAIQPKVLVEANSWYRAWADSMRRIAAGKP